MHRVLRFPISDGSAFIAAAALGKISFEEIPQRVAIEETYDPEPANREVYDLHFREFKNLFRAHKAINRRLNAFHHRK